MLKRLGLRMLVLAGMLCMFCMLSVKAEAAEVVGGKVVAPFGAAMMPVNGKNVNVRSGPGTEYPVLGIVPGGQAVNVCGITDNGWFQVVYGTQIGYMIGNLMQQIPVDNAMLTALAQQAAYVKQQAGMPAAQSAVSNAAVQPAAPAAVSPVQAAPATAAAVPGTGNIIFVGDSRTGQMSNAVGGTAANPGVAFVSCYGGGVSWLESEACAREIEQFLIPGSVVVINYGVNDLGNFDKYISVINEYNRKWREKGVTVYFASVGPVGTNPYGKTNWGVEHFNNQLNGRLSGTIGRINLYQYLTAAGCNIQADGLHYQPDTYAAMFIYLMQSIGR